jgi:hypothetical protein
MVRTMTDSKLPLSFWGECLVMANYLRNLLPTSANKYGASPFEMRYGKLPNLRGLRPFGSHCTVYKHTRDIDGQKPRTRGMKGTLVGYGHPYGKKGYRVYIPSLNKIVTSPNVLFAHTMEESLERRPSKLIETASPDILQPYRKEANAATEDKSKTASVLGSDSSEEDSADPDPVPDRPTQHKKQTRVVSQNGLGTNQQ